MNVRIHKQGFEILFAALTVSICSMATMISLELGRSLIVSILSLRIAYDLYRYAQVRMVAQRSQADQDRLQGGRDVVAALLFLSPSSY